MEVANGRLDAGQFVDAVDHLPCGWLSQYIALWDFMLSLEGREYIKLSNSVPDGPSRMSLSVCSLQMVC